MRRVRPRPRLAAAGRCKCNDCRLDLDAFGPADVPVTGVCVDQQAALFAESCFAPGEAKCTYGTGAFLLASTGDPPDPIDERAGRLRRLAARTPDGAATTWCLDGQVYTVGSAVSWLEEIG